MGEISIKTHLQVLEKQKITINDFKKQIIYGAGGFSIVYKAKFIKTGKVFAIKEIPKSIIIKKGIIDFVYNEKNALSKLYFPLISNLYYSFQDENNLYLIMDFLGGGDLRYYLMNGRIFNEKEIKFILGCIIITIEYIHSKNIIHRDIKPENLLFDDKGYIHLCDFGLNSKINEINDNLKYAGTKYYIAPEGNLSFASDFYSIGVVIYELVMDEVYDYNNVIDFKTSFVERGYSLILGDLVEKLVEFDPEKRLGYINDAFDIKNHEFFQGFNFSKLKDFDLESPIIPKYNLYNKKNKNLFEKEIQHLKEFDSSFENNQEFKNFDYICYNKLKQKVKMIKSSSTKILNINNMASSFKLRTKRENINLLKLNKKNLIHLYDRVIQDDINESQKYEKRNSINFNKYNNKGETKNSFLFSNYETIENRNHKNNVLPDIFKYSSVKQKKYSNKYKGILFDKK